MKSTGTFVSALALAATSAFAAAKDHHQIARALEKRSFSGDATYFTDGMGACGINNGPNDFIVALNTPQYGSGSPGPECFKTITINAGGKSAQATITDECPSCGYGSLDMSQGLFEHFNPTSVGEFPITWSYNDDADTPAAPVKHTTTTTHHTTTTRETTPPPPPPTTTHHTTSTPVPSTTKHTTTTTQTTPTTTSTTTSMTKETTSASVKTSSASPSSTTSTVSGVQNAQSLNQFVANLGNLLEVAAGGQ